MDVQTVETTDTRPRLNYSNGWKLIPSPYARNSTVMETTTAGAELRIDFQVKGSNIIVSIYGTIGPRTPGLVPPSSGYSLDGRNSVYYNASEADSVQYNQLFYQSGLLDIGPHSLIVTNVLQSSALYLDRLLIAQPGYQPSSELPLEPPTTSIALVTTTVVISSKANTLTRGTTAVTVQRALPTAASSTATVISYTPSSSSTTTNTKTNIKTSASASATLTPSETMKGDSSKPQQRTTAIVGSCIGLIFGFVLLATIFLWLLRRRKKSILNVQGISFDGEMTTMCTTRNAFKAFPTAKRFCSRFVSLLQLSD